MRGYLLERHGPPDVLRPSTLPAPEPGPAAHRFMESRRSVGKIVVTLDEG